VDRSLRRLGQLLVVTGALLGAVLGVSLALIVENAESSRAVGAPGRERAAVLAASPPSSQPRASRAASSQDSADGSDSSGTQRAEAADRANQRAGKADKKGESREDKASGRGKKKLGKGNNK
jgi:type IV secretory pathway VirB10-like protein